MIENRICEGIDCLNATLSSGVTSQQLMVAHAIIVGWGSNGVMFMAAVMAALEKFHTQIWVGLGLGKCLNL